MRRLAFTTLLVLGCSGEQGSGIDGPGLPADLGRDLPRSADGHPTASDYCERIVGFFCGFYLRCGRIAETSVEGCRRSFLETCNEVYEPRYGALEHAGLVTLSAPGIAACEAHLSAVPCEQQLLDLAGPCGGMWQGQSPAGSPCGLDIESFVCDQGSTCRLDLSLCGECVKAAKTGGACDGTVHCASASGDRCVGGLCVAPSPPGGDCTDRGCIPGARCEGGTCVAREYVKVGSPCDATHRCVNGSQCLAGACVRSALLGEACAENTPCASGHCDQGGTCESFKAPGAPCSTKDECLSGRCEGGSCGALISGCLKP
jgi:hypothetical protein